MEIDRDLLEYLCPIFEIPAVQIYWYREVFKVGQNNSLSKRLFVVATPGIFLINKKGYAFQSKLVCSMSFMDITSIYISNQIGCFSSKSDLIRIKTQYINEIANSIFLLRQMQFPTDVLPLNFVVNEDDAENRENAHPVIPFSLDTIFRDRTLSCILHLDMTVNSHLIESFKNVPETLVKTIVLTNEYVELPIFQPIMISLMFEQDVGAIRLKGMALDEAITAIGQILRTNRFVQKIIFDDIDFDDCSASVLSLVRDKSAFPPKSLHFVNCDLTGASFESFLDSLSEAQNEIKRLKVEKCRTGNMNALFQAVLFHECFHSLEVIEIDSADNPAYVPTHIIELAGCSWALEKKCLRNISVTYCNIDGSFLLSQVLQFDVGLISINLTGNLLESPLLKRPPSSLQSLNISNCTVTTAFLISLGKVMKDGFALEKLSLSGINFSAGSIDGFIKKMGKDIYEFQALSEFDFSCIPMSSEQLSNFALFIEKQPALKTLILDRSIGVSDSPMGLKKLIKTIAMINLRRLSIKGGSRLQLCCGDLLIGLFKKLGECGIRSLDVSGQALSQAGLDALASAAEKGDLDELYFEGQACTDIEALITICQRLINSKLKKSKFPSADFSLSFGAPIPITFPSKSELSGKIESLRKEFDSRFGFGETSRDLFEGKYTPKPISPPKRSASGNLPIVGAFDDAMKRSSDIQILLNEVDCGDDFPRIVEDIEAKLMPRAMIV